jgi:hypothetical protein
MPGYNLPSYDVKNLSFGPGIAYLGAAGTTPSTDVGAVDPGMTLSVARTILDVLQGVPKRLIERFATQEMVDFEFAGMEWNLDRLQKALGAGNYSVAGDTQTLKFGGSLTFEDLAVRFIHQTAKGGTVDLKIWKCKPSGEVSIEFGDDLHKIPFKATAIAADENWGGEALGDEEMYYEIVYMVPPA